MSDRASLVLGNRFQMNASSWGFWNGRGRNRTAFATLKMATVLPIPSARVRRMTPAKRGFRAKERTA
jgi:hypothetical protein